jgi:SAM-dependent methyltransferase
LSNHNDPARSMLRYLFSHPLTQDIPLDDPRIVPLRAKIVKEKRFLYHIYYQWYQMILNHLPTGFLPVVELGTGPGFLKELLPALFTSDIVPCASVDVILDGQALPFQNASLRAIVMVDVLHHLQNPRSFFLSASRTIQVGGCVLMVEPWVTSWSHWVYTHFHHEKFDPACLEWELDTTKPLSSANGALPWILFSRDLGQFSREFPNWKVEFIQPMMPLVYLLSGGFSSRLSPPGWSYSLCQVIEKVLSPLNQYLGMFALIRLRRLA